MSQVEIKRRICFVDDHPLLLEGLEAMVARHDEFEVCGVAHSAPEALKLIPEWKPDLVITDLTLPGRTGLELIKELKKDHPGIFILVLSMHDEMLYAERVIRTGANGYLMKGAPAATLMKAIHQVLNGGIYLSSKAAAYILGGLTDRQGKRPFSRLESLTDREFEVFGLVGQGKSAHEIGRGLNISPRTVDVHRAHIREKLGLPDSASLMRYAVRWIESGQLPQLEAE